MMNIEELLLQYITEHVGTHHYLLSADRIKMLKSDISTLPSIFRSTCRFSSSLVEANLVKKILQSPISTPPLLFKSARVTNVRVTVNTFSGDQSLSIPFLSICLVRIMC